MEYTTFPFNRPPVISHESDGPFSDPFAEEQSLESLIDLGSLPGCQVCLGNGGAANPTGACPHCQAGAQTLREWLARLGQYQRPDVTVYDRIDIARRFHAPDRPWGEVVGMAREHDLSRKSIYDIAERVRVLFEPRMPGPMPCLKNILPCSAPSQATDEAEQRSREQEATLLHRPDPDLGFPRRGDDAPAGGDSGRNAPPRPLSADHLAHRQPSGGPSRPHSEPDRLP